jgi:NADH-quinone oxidoreductase subunit A
VAKAVRVRVSPSAPDTFNSPRAAPAPYCRTLCERRRPWTSQQYLPVILFILVGHRRRRGACRSSAIRDRAPASPDAEKNSPYECGFEAFEDARMKFDVRYYLVAILFILFDLEIAFLFPWAVALHDIGASGFWAMMIFLGILVVGFVYEWKKGALDWE